MFHTPGSLTLHSGLYRTVLVQHRCAVTSRSTEALSVSADGASNPALLVDVSALNSATGVKVASAAAGSGARISATSTAANESLRLDAKGTGAVVLAQTSTGGVSVANGDLTIDEGGIDITDGPLALSCVVRGGFGDTFTAAHNGRFYSYTGTGNAGFFLPPMSNGYTVELGLAADLANPVTIDVDDGLLYGTINQPTSGITAVSGNTRMSFEAVSLAGSTIRFRSDGDVWYVTATSTIDDGITAGATP